MLFRSVEASANYSMTLWHRNIVSQLAGYLPHLVVNLNVNVSLTPPAQQDNASSVLIQWGYPQQNLSTQGVGYSRINGSVQVDLKGLGLTGFLEERTLWLNVTIALNTVNASASNVAFEMTVLQEQGRPLETLQLTDLNILVDRKSTRLNSSHSRASRMPSSA